MRFLKLLGRDNASSRLSAGRSRLLRDATSPAVEALENRRLLTTVTLPSSTSYVELDAVLDGQQGHVAVFLDH